ncbi:MAG TPA: hypothetical protein VK281_00060, partial [Xanthobacteraceae bacterium]|nr:hypothetical protein [Xanthobacteraceae bacterium]
MADELVQVGASRTEARDVTVTIARQRGVLAAAERETEICRRHRRADIEPAHVIAGADGDAMEEVAIAGARKKSSTPMRDSARPVCAINTSMVRWTSSGSRTSRKSIAPRFGLRSLSLEAGPILRPGALLTCATASPPMSPSSPGAIAGSSSWPQARIRALTRYRHLAQSPVIQLRLQGCRARLSRALGADVTTTAPVGDGGDYITEIPSKPRSAISPSG